MCDNYLYTAQAPEEQLPHYCPLHMPWTRILWLASICAPATPANIVTETRFAHKTTVTWTSAECPLRLQMLQMPDFVLVLTCTGQ